MLKRIIGSALLAAAAVALPASANILLTFEGVGNGANVADFYNGGTDSFGNYGTQNYGIHFNGVVAYNADGAYVKGGASMSFAANIIPANIDPAFVIKFLATAYGTGSDGAPTIISGGGMSDSVLVAGTGNPFCNSAASCQAGGYSYIHPSQLYGYVIASNGTATNVNFATARLDNVEFVAYTGSESTIRLPTRLGSAALDIDIPEPASFSMLALGLVGLALRRRSQK